MSRKMKDSGVEWIGEIPEDWEVSKFKNMYTYKKEIVGERVNEFERLALTLNGIIKRDKEDNEGLQPKQFNNYQIINKNDFIFKMIDLENISTSRVGLSCYNGAVSPAYIRFSPNDKNKQHKYFYYYLMSMYYNCVFNNIGGNGVRSSLTYTDMGNFLCPLPCNEIQKLIAKTLDKKCIQIDALIQNQQQQIEKLKQYKQSLITETVTKGLEPNVPMKDSGVEWIGEIPEDWEVRQIGDVSNVTKLAGFEFTNYFEYIEDGEVIAIRGLNLKNLDIDLSNIRRISLEVSNQLLRSQVNKNDVLISYAGTVGSIGVIRNTDFKYHLAPNVGKITTINILNSIYLGYFLISFSGQENINILKNKNAQESISMSNIRKLNILLPKLGEQEQIANYLDKKCSQIDNLIKIKEEKIQKLNDYKKSIIYEYVTGKKEA